ncbi:hypothetical protein [Actinomadura parmotrematis]|uniref:Uncharacterized protein n=1 Tax=Actinomadura parmotrematis TaxID=2864039 RepID=A0ABS7FYU4_9ACTN|nr:hypothetical protein [Actinomadura parmotrematis]MBW8485115.1 hypothetical protein [Actinomadura parmotrematis]
MTSPKQPDKGASPAAQYRLWRSGFFADTPWAPGGDAEFHGPHVAMRRAGFEVVEWRVIGEPDAPVLGPAERLRTLAHTCECRATLYELCSLGGHYFIRRTVRGPSGNEVAESPRIRHGKAVDLWFRLLRGVAR